MAPQHFDVVIVGAGLSGIGAGVHLTKRSPAAASSSWKAAPRGRHVDLFRYPGIRSDSDMYTLGYHFKPCSRPRRSPTGRRS